MRTLITVFVLPLVGTLMTPQLRANGTQGGTAAATFDLVYVGTYTRGQSKGIYVFKLENDTLVPLGLAADAVNPSFLEIDPARGVLFAVNEIGEFEGQPTGAVSAFTIDRATGRLTLLNQQSSKGRGPCYVVLDRTKRHVLVANYGSGTVAVLPVAADGRLGEATSFVQHTGSSVNPKRQEGPHAHCMAVDPANRFAFACDLGADKVFIYRFDAAKGALTPNDPAFVSLKPGAGPRHMVFRPDGRFAYVTNELHSTVTAFSYDAKTGALKELQTVSTLPPNFTDSNTTAEVTVHPSGRFLYVSNRGHNSIAVFNIDAAAGTLTFVDAQSTEGKTPRHFGIAPSGERIGIANQQSDSVVLGRIDAATGRFKTTGSSTPVSTPTYVEFLPARTAAQKIRLGRVLVFSAAAADRTVPPGAFVFEADRGGRKGQSILVAAFDKPPTPGTGSEYQLLAPAKAGVLPEVDVLGIHYQKVRPERREAFEKFVTETLYPAVGNLRPDLGVLYYKAVRGPETGSYILIFALTRESRDKYWPGGSDSEDLRVAFKPVQPLTTELLSYLVEGSALTDEKFAARVYESREWTDFVLVK